MVGLGFELRTPGKALPLGYRDISQSIIYIMTNSDFKLSFLTQNQVQGFEYEKFYDFSKFSCPIWFFPAYSSLSNKRAAQLINFKKKSSKNIFTFSLI